MEYAYCSDNITDLSKALIEVQRNLSPAVKDAVNPFVKNKYATLNSVMDSCRNALLDNGILLTQYPVPVDGDNLGLVTKLVHAKTGQYQASLAKIPLAKNDAQGLGSAFTYGRRYALSALLGIVTEDDDGNAACNITSPTKKQFSQTAKRVQQQMKPLSAMMTELGLAEMLPCYRQYLESQYGCVPEKISNDQYEEQKKLLDGLQDSPLKMRDFLKMLHGYQQK